MSFYDLALLFDRYGFRIECTTPIDETQMLMRLTPTEWLAPVVSCSVAVISGDDGSDFGGRLGRQMINALLPGEAEVHHLTFAHARCGARPDTIWSCSAPATACFRRCSATKSSTSVARQGGDRHFRHAMPRIDPASGARPPDRTARHLVRALRGRCADVRPRPQQCRPSRRLADRTVSAHARRPTTSRWSISDRARPGTAARPRHPVRSSSHKQVYSTRRRRCFAR